MFYHRFHLYSISSGHCYTVVDRNATIENYSVATRVLRALSSLRGLRGTPEVPPLCRETQSLGQHMLELSYENATVGTNGLSDYNCIYMMFIYVCIIYSTLYLTIYELNKCSLLAPSYTSFFSMHCTQTNYLL